MNNELTSTSTMGSRIVVARASQGLTSSQLAVRMGVLTKTINNWETDRSEPRPNKLVTLAGILQISVMWLMSGQETENDSIADREMETASLAYKMDHLLSHHQQTSDLIAELQGEVNRLQNRIDLGETAITEM